MFLRYVPFSIVLTMDDGSRCGLFTYVCYFGFVVSRSILLLSPHITFADTIMSFTGVSSSHLNVRSWVIFSLCFMYLIGWSFVDFNVIGLHVHQLVIGDVDVFLVMACSCVLVLSVNVCVEIHVYVYILARGFAREIGTHCVSDLVNFDNECVRIYVC